MMSIICRDCEASTTGRCGLHSRNTVINVPPTPSPSWVAQGWQCPQCKRIFAPFAPGCDVCNVSVNTSKQQGGMMNKHDPCSHPNDEIVADLLEGDGRQYANGDQAFVRWCRVCGAVALGSYKANKFPEFAWVGEWRLSLRETNR